MVGTDNDLHLPHPSSVCREERRADRAAREERHDGAGAGDDGNVERIGFTRNQGGRGVLRGRREEGVLRGVEEGRMLRPEPARFDLRVPLETEAVWRDFHGRVRAYVGRRVRRPEEAEDVVQRIFLEVHRGLPRLRQPERLLPWLLRVASNAVIDHYRSPARRREVAAGAWSDLDEIQGDAGTGAGTADPDGMDAAHCLRPVVASLGPRDREAIETIDLRRTSLKAAAAVMGLSLPAMKARVQRARRRLKAALLECCEFVLDGRGGVIDCASRDHVCRGSSSGKECHDA